MYVKGPSWSTSFINVATGMNVFGGFNMRKYYLLVQWVASIVFQSRPMYFRPFSFVELFDFEYVIDLEHDVDLSNEKSFSFSKKSLGGTRT